jgi:flagellin-like hook-associated protein FlgL
MVKINNSLLPIYHLAMSDSAFQRKQIMQAVISGYRNNISVVNQLVGTKLRSDAKLGITGLNRINHGFHFINSATATLTSIKDELEELQNQIVSLRTADKTTLKSAQIMYESTMQNIAHTLKDSQFNGKGLFDGSFADGRKTHVSHCITDNATPFSVRYGTGQDEVINIPIPRLLPGDGRKDNPSVKDTFTPLFSVTENAYKAFEALRKVENVTDADRRVVEGALESLSDAQRRFIVEGLPMAESAEQDKIREEALCFFDKRVERLVERLVVLIPTQVTNLNTTTKYEISMMIFYNSHQELIQQTANSIINVINAAIPAVIDIEAAKGVIQNIPHDIHNTNVIQRLMQSFAAHIINKKANTGEHLNQGQNRLANAVGSLRLLAERSQGHPFSAVLYTGSFTSLKEIENASNVISNAISQIDRVLISLIMHKNSLEHAKTQQQTVIIESSSAADNYLNVNYDELIPRLLQLNRQDKVVSIAFCLSERTLNAILAMLLQTAL